MCCYTGRGAAADVAVGVAAAAVVAASAAAAIKTREIEKAKNCKANRIGKLLDKSYSLCQSQGKEKVCNESSLANSKGQQQQQETVYVGHSAKSCQLFDDHVDRFAGQWLS